MVDHSSGAVLVYFGYTVTVNSDGELVCCEWVRVPCGGMRTFDQSSNILGGHGQIKIET